MTLAGNTVYPYGSIDTNFDPLSSRWTVPLMHRAVDSNMVLLFPNVPGKRWDQMFWKKRLVYRHGCGVFNPLSA
jgi:hypothetical protein